MVWTISLEEFLINGSIIFTRLKRSSTPQLDSEIRKKLNLEHSSLEFLLEPLIPKTPPKNTCFKLELLQPCSKKDNPATLRQKGLETIAILSQDNFARLHRWFLRQIPQQWRRRNPPPPPRW
ncbi:hypothetical protein TNCV_2609471 [Trichonephila clavipes]|nr:hypothetical protein TNCV_2609471 [Trichonephila clavipes]